MWKRICCMAPVSATTWLMDNGIHLTYRTVLGCCSSSLDLYWKSKATDGDFVPPFSSILCAVMYLANDRPCSPVIDVNQTAASLCLTLFRRLGTTVNDGGRERKSQQAYAIFSLLTQAQRPYHLRALSYCTFIVFLMPIGFHCSSFSFPFCLVSCDELIWLRCCCWSAFWARVLCIPYRTHLLLLLLGDL